jgi:L-ribulose-5-phosphate 4-epimerase
VIKPSGLLYEDLRPENMIVVDLQGQIIEGELKPSSDTASHLYIYRHRPDVNGVVHTHSRYATAFAANNRPIPVYLTAIADEFGGPIPCGGFALIGSEAIGQAVLEAIGNSPAVLLKNHGVFTVGPDVQAAVKAAVMVEDVAATVWLALQLGQPDEIPAEEVAKLRRRYTTEYGQK